VQEFRDGDCVGVSPGLRGGHKAQRRKISAKSRLGEKPTYIHNDWDGLQAFMSDGRVESKHSRRAVWLLIRKAASTICCRGSSSLQAKLTVLSSDRFRSDGNDSIFRLDHLLSVLIGPTVSGRPFDRHCKRLRAQNSVKPFLRQQPALENNLINTPTRPMRLQRDLSRVAIADVGV